MHFLSKHWTQKEKKAPIFLHLPMMVGVMYRFLNPILMWEKEMGSIKDV